jgi:hypothetical protein
MLFGALPATATSRADPRIREKRPDLLVSAGPKVQSPWGQFALALGPRPLQLQTFVRESASDRLVSVWLAVPPCSDLT